MFPSFRRLLPLLGLLVMANSLMAIDKVYYFDFLFQPGEQNVTITVEPQVFLQDYDLIKDDDYRLDRFTYDHSMSGPFRQVAFLLRTLERNRGVLMPPAEDDQTNPPLSAISFPFELALRQVTGEVIQEVNYVVTLGLDGEPGKVFIASDTGERHLYDANRLNEAEVFQDFISHLVFPFEAYTLPLPKADAFLVDLYFRWPTVEVDKDNSDIMRLFPTILLWDQGIIQKIKVHQGSAYAQRGEDGWVFVSSAHLRHHAEAIAQYTRALAARKSGPAEEAVVELEDYLRRIPADRNALKYLMETYRDVGMENEALDLITRFQPFFAIIRGGIPNQKELAENITARRNFLLGQRAAFKPNPNVEVSITSHQDNDLVTGTNRLNFVLAGNESPILTIDCFIGEELITTFTEPPFEAEFNVDGYTGRVPLRVVAYFENETYAEDQVTLRTLAVDEEQRVQLVALRASVFQGVRGQRKEFTKDDFRVRENGEDVTLENFRKSTAPLRVAVVIDTSISMFGEKLYRAQYAVKTFLSKFEPEDRATVYTFDDEVLQISQFTNQFDALTPSLMTLSPNGATSLYDAMLVAHDALLGQNGTKVMIVVSDGDDSYSATTDRHVTDLLEDSSVMVYPIILPGGVFGQDRRGRDFLSDVADLTGSMYTRVLSVDNLDETFTRIYEDLKSFYYMDYYTERGREDRKIKVKLKGLRGNLRVRSIN